MTHAWPQTDPSRTGSSTVVILYKESKPLHTEILCEFVRAIHDAGLSAFCVAPDGTPLEGKSLDGFTHYAPGLGAERRIRDTVAAVAAIQDLRRILSTTEDQVLLAASLRREHSVPGLDPSSAIHFRDKNAMAARAAELGFKTARSVIPHTLGTAEAFVAEVGFPVVAKPFDGISCTGAFKINDQASLIEVWNLIRDHRHDYRIEAFVSGQQFHVDTIIRDGRLLFGVVSQYTASLLEAYRDLPLGSVIRVDTEDPTVASLLAATLSVVRGLGMETGIAHTEFFVDQRGDLIFGETAARMGGAWIPPTYKVGLAASMPYIWARAEVDAHYEPDLAAPRPAGGQLLTSRMYGTISAIPTAADLIREDYIGDAQVWKGTGDAVGPATELGSQGLGYIVVTGETSAACEKNLLRAYDLFEVAVDQP